jgi:hypothetical protein
MLEKSLLREIVNMREYEYCASDRLRSNALISRLGLQCSLLAHQNAVPIALLGAVHSAYNLAKLGHENSLCLTIGPVS